MGCCSDCTTLDSFRTSLSLVANISMLILLKFYTCSVYESAAQYLQPCQAAFGGPSDRLMTQGFQTTCTATVEATLRLLAYQTVNLNISYVQVPYQCCLL